MTAKTQAKYYSDYYDRCMLFGEEPLFDDFELELYHTVVKQIGIKKWTGKGDVAVIPDFISFVNPAAFREAQHIKVVDFSYAKQITQFAVDFRHHINLEQVIFGDNITHICNDTLSGTSIKDITIGNKTKEIGERAFLNCKDLTHIKFKRKSVLTRIGVQAFMGTGIKELLLPPSVERLHSRSFCDCANLERVVVNSSLVHLSKSVFEHCTNLKELDLRKAAGMRNVPEYLCYGCTNLETVRLNHNAKLVADYVFVGCDNLKKVSYGENTVIHFTNHGWVTGTTSLISES